MTDVQTFLPYPDVHESARVLDDRRLGKQRVEAYQVVRTLAEITRGWRNHPVVRMWRGHLPALIDYGLVMCREWTSRGKADTVHDKLLEHRTDEPAVLPPWFGEPLLHASHRSNLLRKDPAHYGQFGWAEPPDLPYFWPVA